MTDLLYEQETHRIRGACFEVYKEEGGVTSSFVFRVFCVFRGYLFLCTQQEVQNEEEADKSQFWIHQTRVCSCEEEHYLSTR